MKLLNENEIFNLLKSKNNNLGNLSTLGVDDEMREFLEKTREVLTIKADCRGYETAITGQNIANWIYPLHFEHNLNSALDALESAEFLFKEHREQTLIRIHLNYMEAEFKSGGKAKSKNFNIHKSLVSNINFDDFEFNLNLRLANKLFDLIEYTKAAKLGARLLFGIKTEKIEYKGSIMGVNRIRESLRLLLEEYRRIKKRSREVIIPISLLKALSNSGKPLTSKWGKDKDRTTGVQLATNNLEFDLSLYPEINDLPNQRIRRIGLQIIDLHAMTIPFVKDKGIEVIKHPNLWNLSLHDQGNGFSLGDNILDKFEIHSMLFKDVASSNNPQSIFWSRENSIININANRLWKLNISNGSHIRKPFKIIKDITIHFHLSFTE